MDFQETMRQRSGLVRPRIRRFAAGHAILFALGLCWSAARPTAAAISFPSQPDWISNPQNHYSTGCALRDLNQDGWPDLIVANGNDMARQPVVVYLNANGSFPLNPTWTSADIDYHGHLDLADVDGDGRLDLAVAVYLGPAGFNNPGRVKLYRGNGDGTFSSTPVWTSQENFYCFSVAFGDINMDGRPDLACATGESYDLHRERLRVFRNVNGSLEATPYWQSSGTRYALDVTWGDINGDGLLDLAFACESNVPGGDPIPCPSEAYFGNGTTLSTTPSWQSTDGHDYSNTLVLGDVNGDGWTDLAIADNDQLNGGTEFGRTKLYLNDGHGNLGSLPAWTSDFSGYGSNVSLADVDHDGDLDLAAGSWWGPIRLYENVGGSFSPAATWQSGTGSVIENIVWEDTDNDGLENPHWDQFTGDGAKKLITLPRRPVRLQNVTVAGVPLTPVQFYVNEEQGWLTLASAPGPGVSIQVRYACSADLDFAVSNWDANIGNYLFKNGLNPTEVISQPPWAAVHLMAVPNPAPGACRIEFSGLASLTGLTGFTSVTGMAAHVEIYAATGSKIRDFPVPAASGAGSFLWDGRDTRGRVVPAGSYWLRLVRGDRDLPSTRLVVLH